MKTATSVLALSASVSASEFGGLGGLGGLGGAGFGGLGGVSGVGSVNGGGLLQGGGLGSQFGNAGYTQQQPQYYQQYQQPVYNNGYQQTMYAQPVYQQPVYQQPVQPAAAQVPTYDISGSHGVPQAPKEATPKVEAPKAKVYGSGYQPSTDMHDFMFGTCEFKGFGKVNFFQAPGYASKVKGDLENLTADTEHVLRITEQGDLTGGNCAELGDEFNPLATKTTKKWTQDAWGRWTSYEEPQANEDGRINNLTADADGKSEFRQEDFLQNLGGDDGLFGRGMTLAAKDSDVILACCTIGRDTYREAPTQ